MAAPKTLKFLSGVIPGGIIQYTPPAEPMDQATMAQAILQLQNTVNELQIQHNQLCTDTAHTGDQVNGTVHTAANLFTAS